MMDVAVYFSHDFFLLRQTYMLQQELITNIIVSILVDYCCCNSCFKVVPRSICDVVVAIFNMFEM